MGDGSRGYEGQGGHGRGVVLERSLKWSCVLGRGGDEDLCC